MRRRWNVALAAVVSLAASMALAQALPPPWIGPHGGNLLEDGQSFDGGHFANLWVDAEDAGFLGFGKLQGGATGVPSSMTLGFGTSTFPTGSDGVLVIGNNDAGSGGFTLWDGDKTHRNGPLERFIYMGTNITDLFNIAWIFGPQDTANSSTPVAGDGGSNIYKSFGLVDIAQQQFDYVRLRVSPDGGSATSNSEYYLNMGPISISDPAFNMKMYEGRDGLVIWGADDSSVHQDGIGTPYALALMKGTSLGFIPGNGGGSNMVAYLDRSGNFQGNSFDGGWIVTNSINSKQDDAGTLNAQTINVDTKIVPSTGGAAGNVLVGTPALPFGGGSFTQLDAGVGYFGTGGIGSLAIQLQQNGEFRLGTGGSKIYDNGSLVLNSSTVPIKLQQDANIGSNGANSVYIQSGGSAVNAVVKSSNNSGTASGLTVQGASPDSASAIGIVINNSTTLSTAGAKIASVQNNGTEKSFIDKSGVAYFNGVDAGFFVLNGTGINWVENISDPFTVTSNTGEFASSYFPNVAVIKDVRYTPISATGTGTETIHACAVAGASCGNNNSYAICSINCTLGFGGGDNNCYIDGGIIPAGTRLFWLVTGNCTTADVSGTINFSGITNPN